MPDDLYAALGVSRTASQDEIRRAKNKTMRVLALAAALVVLGLVALFLILPPLDIVLDNLIALVARRF